MLKAGIAAAVLATAVLWPFMSVAQTPGAPRATMWLSWDRHGVETAAGQLLLTNDLGYRIELAQGYIVTLSVELVPCEKWGSRQPVGSQARLYGWLVGRPAYAGHRRVLSQRRLQHSTAESVMTLADWKLGRLVPPDVTYCKAHYLIGRAFAATQSLPQNVDLRNRSIYLKGTYQKPNTTDRLAFEIMTSEASGRIVSLSNSDGSSFNKRLPPNTRLDVERKLVRLFDGVDFKMPHRPETVRKILGNLVRSTVITVTAILPPLIKPD